MSSHAFRAGVMGASGYTGGELLRYLAMHPQLEVAWATADSNAGRTVGDVFGHLVGVADVRLEPSDVSAAPELDVVFLALPHGQAALHGKAFAEKGVVVVDLSADWRLQDPAAYDQWYGWAHPDPASLPQWVYGLPERYRDRIAGARLVANPGCYPTAAILALAPVLQAGAISGERIVINALSGVSGAGRKVDAAFLFTELDASCKAYGVGTHRHTPEIEQELSLASGAAVTVTFTPHLVPMTRGELVTCTATMTGSISDVRDALESAYKTEPFVHLAPEGVQPTTKQVWGSNHVLIGMGADEHTSTVVITCVIDNLGKGAAGQAIQNANLMLGLDETAGLTAMAVYP